MLSHSEKTFITNWEDQKKGPKWKYYLQYSFAWTIVAFFSLFFGIKIIMPSDYLEGIASFYIIISLAIVIGILSTHLVYVTNERKLNRLIEKRNQGNGKDSLTI